MDKYLLGYDLIKTEEFKNLATILRIDLDNSLTDIVISIPMDGVVRIGEERVVVSITSEEKDADDRCGDGGGI